MLGFLLLLGHCYNMLLSDRDTFRNIKLILKTNASYILTSIISNWLSPLNLKCVFNLSSEQILD